MQAITQKDAARSSGQKLSIEMTKMRKAYEDVIERQQFDHTHALEAFKKEKESLSKLAATAEESNRQQLQQNLALQLRIARVEDTAKGLKRDKDSLQEEYESRLKENDTTTALAKARQAHQREVGKLSVRYLRILIGWS